MFHVQTEMEAVVVSEPSIRTVQQLHYRRICIYDAEIQYKRKPPTTRMILCRSLDTVRVGEPVMITYHSGMGYKHSRHVATSNEDNCIGGFSYTDGSEA